MLSESPDEIELVFVKGVEPESGAVTVTGPNGVRYDVPSLFSSRDNVARIGVLPGAVPGHYTVTFQIVSTEAHVLGDGFTYRLNRKAIHSNSPSPKQGDADLPQSPTPASTSPVSGPPSEDGGVTVAVVVAVTLVVVVSIVAVIRRRSR